MSCYNGDRKGGTLPASVRDAFREAVEAFMIWTLLARAPANCPVDRLASFLQNPR